MQYSAEAACTSLLTSLCENPMDRDNSNLKTTEINFPNLFSTIEAGYVQTQ